MYIPEHFAEHRPEQLHRIIRDNPLGILVTPGESGMDADHIPFELDTSHGEYGLLTAHVARSNPVWQRCHDGMSVMVIFRGANAYVSPNGYVSKHETHRQVPTWNYEVVHVHGVLRLIQEDMLLRRTLALLTRHHESSESRPWRMGDAPREYLDEMVSKIVGIEIEPLRVECKRKLNQNKETRNRISAISHLRERGHEALASAMQDTIGL
ncbi:FMN-binding negative transcriptional regulator [Pseudomonas sp. BN417]|uniref:FMN-binding negative transcriptional regulator n=1 Tax=Pseudomonas sp. BN417 TaxID=2567890 RepID=UPI002455A0AD|nr:FMN-binding negative transcriptional regulator [Pseudomonas sp. BN417]MDH4558137.1 FMN-binding negative transcriptional regulator [Pseudomonas sp. BN417]